jgi:hypothetical protein
MRNMTDLEQGQRLPARLRDVSGEIGFCRLWAQGMLKWHSVQKCSGLYSTCETVGYLEDTSTYSCLDYRILWLHSWSFLQIIKCYNFKLKSAHWQAFNDVSKKHIAFNFKVKWSKKNRQGVASYMDWIYSNAAVRTSKISNSVNLHVHGNLLKL